MTAPRMGPHMRAHSIGGPACRMVRAPSPGTTIARPAGRRPARAARPGCARRPARFARRDARAHRIVRDRPRAAPARSPSSRSPPAGGRQSSGTTAAPCARGATANSRDADVQRADAAGKQRSGVPRSSRHPPRRPPAARRQPGRLGVARREDDCPPPSSVGFLAGQAPGDRRRCRRRRRRSGQRRGLRDRPRARVDGRRERAGRVGVSAVAQHHVEQDHGGGRIRGRRPRCARCAGGSRSSGAGGPP